MIRVANLEDLPTCVALLEFLFEQEWEFIPNKEARARGLWMVLSDPDCGFILLACEEEVVQGMVLVLRVPSTALGEWVGIVEDMIVDCSSPVSGVGGRQPATFPGN